MTHHQHKVDSIQLFHQAVISHMLTKLMNYNQKLLYAWSLKLPSFETGLWKWYILLVFFKYGSWDSERQGRPFHRFPFSFLHFLSDPAIPSHHFTDALTPDATQLLHYHYSKDWRKTTTAGYKNKLNIVVKEPTCVEDGQEDESRQEYTSTQDSHYSGLKKKKIFGGLYSSSWTHTQNNRFKAHG